MSFLQLLCYLSTICHSYLTLGPLYNLSFISYIMSALQPVIDNDIMSPLPILRFLVSVALEANMSPIINVDPCMFWHHTILQMFQVAMHGSNSHHNHPFCTFCSMECDSEIINTLVTDVPNKHLHAVMTSSSSILMLEDV